MSPRLLIISTYAAKFPRLTSTGKPSTQSSSSNGTESLPDCIVFYHISPKEILHRSPLPTLRYPQRIHIFDSSLRISPFCRLTTAVARPPRTSSFARDNFLPPPEVKTYFLGQQCPLDRVSIAKRRPPSPIGLGGLMINVRADHGENKEGCFAKA